MTDLDWANDPLAQFRAVNTEGTLNLARKAAQAGGALDDGEPVSTPDLIRAMARAMGRTARLLGVRVGRLEFMGMLMGQARGGGAAGGAPSCGQFLDPAASGVGAAVLYGGRVGHHRA